VCGAQISAEVILDHIWYQLDRGKHYKNEGLYDEFFQKMPQIKNGELSSFCYFLI
jgi:hypothetical protein